MRFILALVVLGALMLASGCTQTGGPPQLESFSYQKDGRTYEASLFPGFGDSMEWVRENLPEDAVVTAWWDYGHMIRGLGEREAVVFNPSEDILHTVSMVAAGGEFDAGSLGELSDHEDIEMVAMALTTTDPSEAMAIMLSYHSDYIMVTQSERSNSWVLYDVSGVEAEQLDEYTFVNEDSMMYRILDGEGIPGMEEVYSDSTVTIYGILR